jgi:dihydrofolate reductase
MASVDGLVMGRGSYETVLSFEPWPYENLVVVLARTMGDADVLNYLKGSVRITVAMRLCVMGDLATDDWAHAYVDGGLVVHSFLRDGLISDHYTRARTHFSGQRPTVVRGT